MDIFWSEKNINEYLSNLKINFTYFDCILCNNNHILNIYKKNIEKKKYFCHLKLNYKYNNLVKPDIFYIGELCKSSLTNEFIKKINTYGIGINCKQNYNNIFAGNGEYKDNRIKTIRDEIVNICYEYNLNLNMN